MSRRLPKLTQRIREKAHHLRSAPPKPSSSGGPGKGVSLKFSAIDDSFDAVMDKLEADLMNPVFEYDDGEGGEMADHPSSKSSSLSDVQPQTQSEKREELSPSPVPGGNDPEGDPLLGLVLSESAPPHRVESEPRPGRVHRDKHFDEELASELVIPAHTELREEDQLDVDSQRQHHSGKTSQSTSDQSAVANEADIPSSTEDEHIHAEELTVPSRDTEEEHFALDEELNVNTAATRIVNTAEETQPNQSAADFDEAFSEHQTRVSSELERDAFGDEDEDLSGSYPGLPSVDELLEHGIVTLRPEDYLYPRDESPLSSPPSSYEEHYLMEHPTVAVAQNEMKPQLEEQHYVATHSMAVPDGTESPAALEESGESHLESEHVPAVGEHSGSTSPQPPKPRANSDTTPLIMTTEHPLISEDSDLLTYSGEYPDNPDLGSLSNDELVPIQDHFANSPKARETSYIRPDSKQSHLSASVDSGSTRKKVPPPRPPSSPKLRRKIQERKQGSIEQTAKAKEPRGQSRKSDEDVVRVKLVRPLESVPPRIVKTPPAVVRAGNKPAISPEPSPKSVGGVQAKPDIDELFPDDKLAQSTELNKQSETKVHIPFPQETSKHETTPESTMKAEEKRTAVIEEDLLFSDKSETKPSPAEQLLPDLPLELHLLLAGLLYLYYSFNTFSYFAGLFAGFLMLYLTLGAAFIYLVQHEERKRGAMGRGRRNVQPSDAFVKQMRVNFDNLKACQTDKFTLAFNYDFATHHVSMRIPTELMLFKDFTLIIKYQDQTNSIVGKEELDIRRCTVSLVPVDIAQNRKRRWSKKFPIKISWSEARKHYSVYIFVDVSRNKEKWFRRLKAASEGKTSQHLIQEMKEFFGYMQKYFPSILASAPSTAPAPSPTRPSSHASMTHSAHQSQKKPHSKNHPSQPSSLVQFSNRPESDSEEDSGAISIKKTVPHRLSNGARRQLSSNSSAGSMGTSVDSPQPTAYQGPRTTRHPSLDENGFEIVNLPPSIKLPKETDWLNALAARLCWDVWHEERWKTWVMTRIQKKLARVKTPPFLEKLHLSDVQLGNDMPVLNRLHSGPRLDLWGIWVYLDVTYRGSFVMTIETKMKLGLSGRGPESAGREMHLLSPGRSSSSPEGEATVRAHRDALTSSHMKSKALSHGHAVRALAMGSSVDPEDVDTDSGSDEEGSAVAQIPVQQVEGGSMQEHAASSPAHEQSGYRMRSRFKQMRSMVSQLTKRVANTRIVRKAAEKVSSYPLVLTVEVNKLDGILAVNIPPPPTDTIWYGFQGSPRLELVAKPKLGQREVTLSQVTHWIEKKLCELVDKKLLLPNMEDLVIPILNSGLPEDKHNPLASPTTPHEHSSY